MARIFITGSADGLGQMAASALIDQGHQVVLHARNDERATAALQKNSGAEDILIADLSSLEATKKLAIEVNNMGHFDAIIHNAGVYNLPSRQLSADGLPIILAVNTIAPFILTSLIERPDRLIYMSSGMHLQGDASLKGLAGESYHISYADSKLHDLILSKAVARKWIGVKSNAVDPGWVPTKMGGAHAPDDLAKGYQTQVWLAANDQSIAAVNGTYLHHQRPANYLKEADDISIQEQLLYVCENISGVKFPS